MDALSTEIIVRPTGGHCQVCKWPTDGLALRFVTAMRSIGPRCGVDACVRCLHRAEYDAQRRIVKVRHAMREPV